MLRCLSLSACVVLCVASCSTISPKRVTPDNEKTAVGLRYYETRPFLVVRKPYPIASTPYLVQGVLANDGKSFFVTNAPPELGLPAWTELRVGQPIAPSAHGGTPTPAAQGEVPTDAADKAKDAAKDDKNKSACQKGTQSTTKKEGETSETEQVDCKDTSGQRLAFSSISLETDLTGTAIVPINELFSIVYLPDYDREFYVESKARWGMSKLHVVRGPGGALLAYNSEVDNSAVVKPIFDAWNALMSAATKAAVIKIEPKAQGERVDGTKTAALTPQGTPETIRIHRVKFAVPGVYPFIKSQEITSNTWQGATTTDSKRMLVPSFPYQVPYDYFDVLIAEHLLDPPGSSSLVSNVTATYSPESAGGAPGSPSGGQNAASAQCAKNKLPQGSYSAANANILLQSAPELKDSVIKVTVTSKDVAGCATALDVKFKGAATKKDGIEAKLKASFAEAQFNVTPE